MTGACIHQLDAKLDDQFIFFFVSALNNRVPRKWRHSFSPPISLTPLSFDNIYLLIPPPNVSRQCFIMLYTLRIVFLLCIGSVSFALYHFRGLLVKILD